MRPAPTITAERPDRPDVVRLIAASHAYMAALYPAESNHHLGLDGLLAPSVRFLVARDDGAAIGCGALVADPPTGEVKSMWVDPAHRGCGIARALMQALEAQARSLGITHLALETGIHQPEAVALYESMGFAHTGPFGSYKPDPLSVFMQKDLAGAP